MILVSRNIFVHAVIRWGSPGRERQRTTVYAVSRCSSTAEADVWIYARCG